ncbi:MAG: DNA polymerase IV [Bacteroidales bacterium]|nr:DNA polymerase IV [Bacteroidales bacterium]
MNSTPPQRKIIHVDMDAFYASVEQMDHPELKGKPVAVGGGGERGVVAAASYEARKFGVHSAMSGALARKQCPNLIFVKPRFERYKEISMQIRAIFYEYSDLVEPLSLDEAFIDVTENKKNISSASRIAREIREQIFKEVGLRASAGISINKFTAKIASDINKPNGQKTINPDEVIPFLEQLKIEKFFGVGKVTAEKMKQLGVFKGLDLKQKSMEFLVRNFGKSGYHFYNIVRGIQHSEVRPNRIRKSIAAENTFHADISEMDEMLLKLSEIALELERRINRSQVKGKTITLKLKYSDFTQQTRSKTIEHFISEKEEFFPIIESLLQQEEIPKAVRLLGISISKLDTEIHDDGIGIQLRLNFPTD